MGKSKRLFACIPIRFVQIKMSESMAQFQTKMRKEWGTGNGELIGRNNKFRNYLH